MDRARFSLLYLKSSFSYSDSRWGISTGLRFWHPIVFYSRNVQVHDRKSLKACKNAKHASCGGASYSGKGSLKASVVSSKAESHPYARVQAFIVLMVLAIYNVSRITSLHLPLSVSAAVLSVLIPITHVAGGIWLLVNVQLQDQLSLHLGWLSAILDTILITISSVGFSEQGLSCSLDTTWRSWFQHKNDKMIREVQNRLDCCGLRSSVDKAWPFPDKAHRIDACRATYGHDTGCYLGWSREARQALSIFVAIGVVSLIVKVGTQIAPISIALSLIGLLSSAIPCVPLTRPHPKWKSAVWSSPSPVAGATEITCERRR